MPKRKLHIQTYARHLSAQIEEGADLGQEGPEEIQSYLLEIENRLGLETDNPDDGFNLSL